MTLPKISKHGVINLDLLGLWRKYSQFLKFSLVGASNTLISFVLYYILIKLGLHYIISNVLAYSAGVVNSYILNSTWVFRDNSQPGSKLFKFITVNLGALLLSSSLLYLCVDTLGINKIISQVIVTALVLLVNYTGNKLWTFKNA
jgi:putative flippase GtrA